MTAEFSIKIITIRCVYTMLTHTNYELLFSEFPDTSFESKTILGCVPTLANRVSPFKKPSVGKESTPLFKGFLNEMQRSSLTDGGPKEK